MCLSLSSLSHDYCLCQGCITCVLESFDDWASSSFGSPRYGKKYLSEIKSMVWLYLTWRWSNNDLFMFVHLWFEAPLFMFDLHNPFASWTEIHPHPNRKLSQNCRSKIDCAAWPLYRDPATLLVADCFIDLSKPGMRSANHIFSKYCEEDVLRTPSQTWAQYEQKCFDVIPPSSQLVIPCSNWIQVRGTSPCHACHVHKISTQLMVEVISQAGRRKKWQEALQLLETQRIAT